MRNFLILGAAALVVASPAPQAFDPNALDAMPVTATDGPPVGVGPAQETGYNQAKALAEGAAAATGPATAQMAKRSAEADLERRLLFNWGQPAPAPAPEPAPAPAEDPSSKNYPPSSCTPKSWSNTGDPCAPQPNAYGPDTKPDTVEAFKNNHVYHDLAKSAKTPSGWSQSFHDLDGSVEGAGYLSFKTLTSYDPAQCSKYCDETDGCTGFNIFIERDPKWNPWKCSCEPPSIAQIKCSIWGMEVKAEAATNKGQHRSGFDIVIVASNGYNKQTYNPPSPPGTSHPSNWQKKLLDKPQYCIGEKTFPGPFNPSVCAAYAQKQNEINKSHGLINSLLGLIGLGKGACVQYQAAYFEKAGKGFGTNCRLFAKKFSYSGWDTKLLDISVLDISVSVGGTSKWGCQKSYTWDLDPHYIFNWGGLLKRHE